MTYRFEDIAKSNVDDLVSICGNMPGVDKNPHFIAGRAARQQWVSGMIERFGTIGVLAYGQDGQAKGFVECVPSVAHPLGRHATDPRRTMTIDCAWYRQDPGLPVRKAVLDHMFSTGWFDKRLDDGCRFVDVLTLKGAPLMQYDFYHEYGFRDAVELIGPSTSRFLLRFPVKGDVIASSTQVVDYPSHDRNVLYLGAYDQCFMPFMVNAKIRDAVKNIDELSVKEVDYWGTGMPPVSEPYLNGEPAFERFVFFMDDEQIRESIRKKMV
ncbi:MAG: hypothetical protein SA339_06710 [Methanomassiliicoccus sp.]|nr:hypothetical protein [Methanomassiliicoccus sp.]